MTEEEDENGMDALFGQMETLKRPAITRKPWMDSKKMELITTVEVLTRAIDECINSQLYAIDLETTGLDSRVFNGRTNDRIVGVCLSPDGERGYYIPIRHKAKNGDGFHEACLPAHLVEAELRRLVNSDSVAIFHNGKFDHEFLQFCGGEPIGEWDDPRKWEDTLILAYIRNTRERNKGLKRLSEVELGMEMIELPELFMDEEREAMHGGMNFAFLDPTWEPAIWYGCSDAICTYLLYKKIVGQAIDPTESGLPSQKPLYFIEKMCLPATRWMERNRIPIDREKVKELIRVGQREWLPALGEVYQSASAALGRDITPGYYRLLIEANDPLDSRKGRFRFDPENTDMGISASIDMARDESHRQSMDPVEADGKIKTLQKRVPHLTEKKQVENIDFPYIYDILIPDQIGLLLRELGVEGLSVTEKSGQIKTSKDELDRVIEDAGEQFPFIPKVKRFREVAKAIASNLLPILEDTTSERSPDGRIKINFEAFRVDTGRFSTPAPKEQKGFTGVCRWNLHSIPATYDTKKPECMLRIREVIRAKDGRKLVAVDYSGQELRIAANLSNEPLWIQEFFRCADCGHAFSQGEVVPPPPEPPPPYCPTCGSDKIGDLHTLTALSVYGEDSKNDPDFKQKRQSSKSLNFAMAYGGGPSAAQRAVGCSREEAQRIKKRFDGTYKGLSGWWKTQHEFARKTKHVLTPFHRRYPLPDIDHADGGFRSKAERNATNGPIQGGGGDLMKYAMGLLFREFKKRGWLDRVLAVITIHDELVFEIEDALLQEAIPVIKDIMLKRTTAKLSWRVPLTCDIEIGYDWTVPWNYTKILYGKKKAPPELAHMFAAQPTANAPAAPPENRAPEPVPTAPAPNMSQNASPNADVPPPAPASHPAAVPTVAPVMPPPSVVTSPAATQERVLGQGEPLIHKVAAHELSLRLMHHFARVIHKCRGRGTHPLHIVTDTNVVLWGDEDEVLVDPNQARVLLNDRDPL